MPSKLDVPPLLPMEIEGLPWRVIAQKLRLSQVKVTADELLRYMRRASKKAAKILAELAPLEALEAKQRARLSEPPPAVPTVGGKRSQPTVEEIKKRVAAEIEREQRPVSKWDKLEPDFRKPQL